MRLAFVTFRALPQLSDDDRLAVRDLRKHGVTVESAVWDSPLVEWSIYDALVLRSTWDHHERSEEFETWLARVEHLGVPVWNPPALVRWNLDKRYLLDLALRGVSTVPTQNIARGTPTSLAEVMALTGWRDVVYKPALSASGVRTARVTSGDEAAHEPAFAALVGEHDTLVQPFMPEVVEDGEWSLVFLGQQYSHAVKKRARAGEFRVQSGYGASVAAEAPRGALIAQAEALVSHLPSPWLYARVDACETDGQLVLMELELVDPELFLSYHPSAPRRFSTALRQLAAGRRTPLAFTPRSVTPHEGTEL